MITQQQKDTLNEYAKIKGEIKLLEAKADELNPLVFEVMQASEAEEITLENVGKFSLGSRRTWKYSQGVQDLEQSLKSEKKIEEQTGKADYSEKHYVLLGEALCNIFRE